MRQKDAEVNGALNGRHPINIIHALLELALESAPTYMLDARLAASDCLKAYMMGHAQIQHHFLERILEFHTSGVDPQTNLLTILVASEQNRSADPYRSWIASVLMFHLIFEDPEAKAMAMKITEGDASAGEEEITCVQALAGNLLSGIQRGEDERVSVGYLMLLCGWLFEDPDVVNDFLGEGSSIQSLIQIITQASPQKILVPGLCALLLGTIYEFSSKDSPIPRATLHQILTSSLGREQYIDKIRKLRELSLIRDFEVLPQNASSGPDGVLPEVFFDKSFVDFLKDNFSRLMRAIDRDPGLEIPVIANGIQKGISRELVDSLRAQVDDKTQALQKAESAILVLEGKLGQEQADHRRDSESATMEVNRIKQINDALQRGHEEESRTMQEHHRRFMDDAQRRHQSELQALEVSAQQAASRFESEAAQSRLRTDAEIADLRKTIDKLEAEISKLNADHMQDLSTAHEEYSSQKESLELRAKRAEGKSVESEERAKRAEERARSSEDKAKRAENKAKDALTQLVNLRKEVDEKEKARVSTQTELDDLLVVFGDLEEKRQADKVSGFCSSSNQSILGFQTNTGIETVESPRRNGI